MSARDSGRSPTSTLASRRRELAERVAGLTWDLGGLCYEMAIRDHFRVDVLARRAALLQQADAELGEVERMLAAENEGIGGQCKACGAAHSRGASFCWRCGQSLVAHGPVGPATVGQTPAPPAVEGTPATAEAGGDVSAPNGRPGG